jgi:hypothetical protein
MFHGKPHRSGWRALLLLAATLLPAAGVHAHHSAAMFDDQHRISLAGTVRKFQWTNPHCYVQLVVKDDKGKDVEWSLEMAGPMYLYNLGFRPSTLKAGDKLTVKISPLRNGSKGGLLVEAITADGKRLGISK